MPICFVEFCQIHYTVGNPHDCMTDINICLTCFLKPMLFLVQLDVELQKKNEEISYSRIKL